MYIQNNKQNKAKIGSNLLSWLQLDTSAFKNNIAVVNQLIGPRTKLAFVVKANAYGHGLLEMAYLADQLKNVDYLCTSSISEALRVRAIGIKKPILVLAILDASIEQAILNSIDLVVYSIESAQLVNVVAESLKLKASVHVKIDTGLSRLGFRLDEQEPLKNVFNLKNLNIVGLFTHFAESDKQDSDFTDLQIKRFKTIINFFKKSGVHPKYVHSNNSSAVALGTEGFQGNFVRVGGLAYGLTKSEAVDKVILEKTGKILKPILSWHAKIIQIKHVKAGEYIGYSRTKKADKNLTLAVVPVGYADGYLRELSNKGCAYIGEHKIKVVGRISMNMLMLDVTGLDLNVGFVVELVGNKHGIRVRDIAKLCNTIDYDITNKINPDISRFF